MTSIDDLDGKNELYRIFMSSDSGLPSFYNDMRRIEAVKKYSWAVPTIGALRAITAYDPIVEMGAGTGYWAYLLQHIGCNIIAYDKNPPDQFHSLSDLNPWHGNITYTEVKKGTPEILTSHSDRTLFLCWPPYDNSMACQCLHYWEGEYLVYIGEDCGGVTGNDEFYETLDKKFSLIKVVDIPQWLGIHDRMTIWSRT